MTLEGSSSVAFFCSSGANLVVGGVSDEGCLTGVSWLLLAQSPDVQSNGIEDTLHVQVHYFCESLVWMGIE